MADLILTTFDWVPERPRGYVRDLRVRWALEEAGLPYGVRTVPFRSRHAEHFSRQPFGQVPWLTDGDISIFESGAILLHLGERSDTLMPADPYGRSKVLAEREWRAGSFSIADILMADVLRLVDRFDGLMAHPSCRDYVARATARPTFVKAYADQIAHFAAAD